MARAKFSKSDLVSGQVVEYRNGNRRLVVKDFLGTGRTVLFGSGDERFTYLDNFNDDLTHASKDALDIVKVLNHSTDPKATGDLYLDTDVVWDKNKPVVMTLAEVCDTLGYDVVIAR